MTKPQTLHEASCADDYDPNSMPVERARELIRRFLVPVTVTERVHVRQALGRVLAEDVVSPVDVPGHDNSAMDGWAVRFADLAPGTETRLVRIGESFAGKPFGGSVGAGQAVRIFTGAVMPAGADSVVMQERAREVEGGVAVAPGAVTQAGQNRRFAGEDLQARRHRVPRGPAAAPRRARHDRFARHQRALRLPAAARRLLLHRRRAGVDRAAARRRPDLRQQPLHDPRDADAPRLRRDRHGGRARRPCAPRARVRHRRRERGRRRHVGGRVGRRSRLTSSS